MEVIEHAGMPIVIDHYHGATSCRCAGRGADACRDLLHPFEFEFFRNGVLVATIAGALCGLVGVFVVLKGMSYIGHGLSHAIFGGYAASALLGVNFVLGAGVWGVASALMITGVTRRRIIAADAAIGVITTASFALGLALFALFGRRGANFDSALFGSILGVDTADVVGVAIVAVVAGLVVFFGYRALLFTTFDPEVAEASGRAHRGRRRRADGDPGGVDPRHDAGARRDARRGERRDPAERGALAHQLVQPDALAVDGHRRGGRVHRDERQLPPRRAVGPRHRAGRGERVRGGDGGRQRPDARPPRPGVTGSGRAAGPVGEPRHEVLAEVLMMPTGSLPVGMIDTRLTPRRA